MTAPWLQPAAAFASTDWSAGWSTSAGPDFRFPAASPEQENSMLRLAGAAGLRTVAWTDQVHEAEILRAERPGLAGQADGLWTDVPGLGVVGRSADCPLVLVGGSRPDGSAVWGFAHASWRSTVRSIGTRLIAILAATGADPRDLIAQICPSAGPCCYEVGPEVRQEALDRLGGTASEFFTPHRERWILDLWAANRAQLERAGLRSEAIYDPCECTICGDSSYPSHRRDGARAGRFAATIGRR